MWSRLLAGSITRPFWRSRSGGEATEGILLVKGVILDIKGIGGVRFCQGDFPFSKLPGADQADGRSFAWNL